MGKYYRYTTARLPKYALGAPRIELEPSAPKADILPLYYAPYLFPLSGCWSGWGESNSRLTNPNREYYRYTTSRVLQRFILLEFWPKRKGTCRCPQPNSKMLPCLGDGRQLAAATAAGLAALPAGAPSFLGRPFVRGALGMSGAAALRCYFALLFG
jgi:hypothetical protein